jgi:hypothetical protein
VKRFTTAEKTVRDTSPFFAGANKSKRHKVPRKQNCRPAEGQTKQNLQLPNLEDL